MGNSLDHENDFLKLLTLPNCTHLVHLLHLSSTSPCSPFSRSLGLFRHVGYRTQGVGVGARGRAGGAARLRRNMGCIDESAAIGILAWALRRRWAMTALRENARLKLERIGQLGHGASAASQRRTSARAAWSARQAARAAGALAHTSAWRRDR